MICMTGGGGMIDTHELKRRDLYLDKLKAFQDGLRELRKARR